MPQEYGYVLVKTPAFLSNFMARYAAPGHNILAAQLHLCLSFDAAVRSRRQPACSHCSATAHQLRRGGTWPYILHRVGRSMKVRNSCPHPRSATWWQLSGIAKCECQTMFARCKQDSARRLSLTGHGVHGCQKAAAIEHRTVPGRRAGVC